MVLLDAVLSRRRCQVAFFGDPRMPATGLGSIAPISWDILGALSLLLIFYGTLW